MSAVPEVSPGYWQMMGALEERRLRLAAGRRSVPMDLVLDALRLAVKIIPKPERVSQGEAQLRSDARVHVGGDVFHPRHEVRLVEETLPLKLPGEAGHKRGAEPNGERDGITVEGAGHSISPLKDKSMGTSARTGRVSIGLDFGRRPSAVIAIDGRPFFDINLDHPVDLRRVAEAIASLWEEVESGKRSFTDFSINLPAAVWNVAKVGGR